MPAKNSETQAPVAIKKVIVQLGKKELVIDIEDAKQLRDALNTLFGGPAVKEVVIREEHHHYPKPFYWDYSKPIWNAPNWGYKWSDGAIYCSNITTGDVSTKFSINADNGPDDDGSTLEVKR
jgi:hypothetical protein